MTREEAVKMYDSKWYEGLPHDAIAAFQLFEERLCMPFDLFHEAVEKTLGRPVFSHEFAFVDKPGGLRAEFLGNAPARSFKEILDLIPQEKRIIIEL